jgi:hypothetical protein
MFFGGGLVPSQKVFGSRIDIISNSGELVGKNFAGSLLRYDKNDRMPQTHRYAAKQGVMSYNVISFIIIFGIV